MARFEGPRGRGSSNRASYGGRNRENSKGGKSSQGNRGGGRSYGRDSSRNAGGLTLTKAICAKCHVECEVPFKPTSNKPVLCRSCFTGGAEQNKSRGTSPNLEKEIKEILIKVNKIMEALNIE